MGRNILFLSSGDNMIWILDMGFQTNKKVYLYKTDITISVGKNGIKKRAMNFRVLLSVYTKVEYNKCT